MILNKDSLVGLKAPDFPDNLRWFNLPAGRQALGLKLKDLTRNVVLLDFWTYSCINCLRTLPYLRQWYERYKDYKLVIIGVHSPEFEFEKDPKNLELALKHLDIHYPVVSDDKRQIWNLYRNSVWPRKLLVDPKGYIIYDHIGEGAYGETEKIIQNELNKIVFEPLKFPAPLTDGDSSKICSPTTPEYHLGSLRGHFGNPSSEGGWYQDSMDHQQDTVYLQGAWKVEPEYVEHTQEATPYEDYLLLNFRASEVNLVMGAREDAEALIEIQFNNEPLEQAILGHDIIVQDEKTLVKVKEPRLYNLIDSLKYLQGEVKVLVNQKGWRAYAFTFSGCQESP